MKKLLFLLTILIVSVHVQAQVDASGCKDHPVVTRYPGSVIQYCDIKNHVEFAIATGPETGYRKISEWKAVSGKQTRIYYSLKGNTNISEVYQNYLNAIKNSKFELIVHKLHGERNVSGEVGGNTWLSTFYQSNQFPSNVGIKINQGSGSLGGTFYIAAKKDNVWLVLSGKRYSDNETVALLDVIEEQDMVNDLIKINADFIADRLFKDGKIELPGIHFDHNLAVVKEESLPLISEIAAFLHKHTNVTILVVGHTDMTGEIPFNIELSKRRANAVSDILVNNHKIEASRLIPHGVGPLSPVKGNFDEPGKAANRRVELVLYKK